jgi:CRP-like cAMP-binding protein
MQLTRYSKRDIVIQKGSHGYDLLFLLNGRLQVVDVTDDGREVGLSFILPGSFFGELSIIDNLPRSASVLALTTADVISLPKEIALRLFYHTPVIAEMIVKHLAKPLVPSKIRGLN